MSVPLSVLCRTKAILEHTLPIARNESKLFSTAQYMEIINLLGTLSYHINANDKPVEITKGAP
jgi:hypothetical protein